MGNSYSSSALLVRMVRGNPTYRANDGAYFFGRVGSRMGWVRSMLARLCRMIARERRGPRRNSCAYCLFSRKLSGVLGGINRRSTRAVVTTGGNVGRSAINRVSSLLFRLIIVVGGRKVAPSSMGTRLSGHRRGSKGLGGFRRISGGA